MSGTIAITGATGFIGTHLAAGLRAEGRRVIAFVRPGSPRQPPDGVEVRTAPLAADVLQPLLDDVDALVHLAGVTQARGRRRFDAVNLHGTQAVAQAASRAGVRLIHVSSQAAAGTGTPSAPRRETDAPAPLTDYGRSKLAGEEAVRAVPGLDWTILRPVAVYGPGDRAFLPLFRLAARGLFLRMPNTSSCFSLIHVDDVASAIGAALRAPAAVRETVFVTGLPPVTGDDVGIALAAAVGRHYRPRTVPWWAVRGLAGAGELVKWAGLRVPLDGARLTELTAEGFVCSPEKAAGALGFRAATALPDGFRSTAAWYRERGWI